MKTVWRCRLPLVGIAALLAASCTNDVVAPVAASRPALRTTVTPVGTGLKGLVSNSIKYKDAGVKPGTGRSGSASLEARALLGKDGSTQVEASTGSLEAGTSVGTIEKVQLKIFTGDTLATNYNKLAAGGYWTQSYASLARGHGVQVQANVTGIDPKRTDVVTVQAAVALRPDIAVRSVRGPAESTSNAPVTFTATVSEQNGDVGARSDCVMLVNGANVDRADRIWVDAGGTVTCMFTYVFETPGNYEVSVTATGVAPGDWDPANNTGSTSLTVLERDKPIQSGWIVAQEISWTWNYHAWNTTGLYPFDQFGDETRNTSFASIGGWAAGGPPPGGVQRIDGTLWVNGAVVNSVSLTPRIYYSWAGDDVFDECVQYFFYDELTATYSPNIANWCSYGSLADPSARSSYYNYQYFEGEITYYGNGYYCWEGGCNSYSYNGQYRSGSGSSLGWGEGAIVRLQVSFVGDDGVPHTADESVTLASSPINESYSYCWYDSWRRSNSCQSSERSGSFLQGVAGW